MFKKSLFMLLIISLLLISFLLSGCSGPASPDQLMASFAGGINGLKVSVMEGAPPSVVPDGGAVSFSVIVPLENVGEAPVGPGTENPFVMVRLAGIMYPNFGLTPETAVKTLETKLEPVKKSFGDMILPGEMGYVSFDNLAYKPRVADSFSLTIRAEACYDYESHAITSFCMKKDVLESAEDSSICMLRGSKPVGNSGSPIHITRVEEAPLSNMSVQINFVIEHVGQGIFFLRNEAQTLLNACAFDELNPDIYKLEVFVEPIEKNTYDVKCMILSDRLAGGGAHGVVRMFQGAPLTLSCFLTRTKPMSVRVYSDILNIRLRYRYGEFVEVPILIQPHP
jgi:hypothetical protein